MTEKPTADSRTKTSEIANTLMNHVPRMSSSAATNSASQINTSATMTTTAATTRMNPPPNASTAFAKKMSSRAEMENVYGEDIGQ